MWHGYRIRELHTIIRDRAQSQADHNSFTAIALCVCHEQSETRQKLAPKSKILKACRYLAIPRRFGHRGRGYEEPQRGPPPLYSNPFQAD
jgi:hypothetical protein